MAGANGAAGGATAGVGTGGGVCGGSCAVTSVVGDAADVDVVESTSGFGVVAMTLESTWAGGALSLLAPLAN
jgi:hypothetical protein